jgi:hypothetical protein
VSGDDGEVVQVLAPKGIIGEKGVREMYIELAMPQRRSPFGEQRPQGFGSTHKGSQGRIEGKRETTDRGTEGEVTDLIRNLIVESVDTGAGIDSKVCRMAGTWLSSEYNAITTI